ncbi:hypothetical protein GCM10027089_62540 [Nocardia thraciensis]
MAVAVVICVVVVWIVVWPDIREPRDNPPIVQTARHARVTEHPRQRHWPDDPPTLAVVPYTHTAPGRPFTVGEARTVMRQHIECTPGDCARKREARRVLVESGVMRPRTRKRLPHSGIDR